MPTRKLRVFLCHASDDKPAVRTLYASLKSIPWIDPWLDEENLLPGQDWDLEIYKATRDADAIIICLSTVSVKKEGYINKEIRHALDIAKEKPEGAIYVIPLRLDDCKPSFEQLKKLQWVDYFIPNTHDRLLKSLRLRADVLKINVLETTAEVQETPFTNDGLDLYRFIKIEPQKNSKVKYPFWIGKYPVTNANYERFLNTSDYPDKRYWDKTPDTNSNRVRFLNTIENPNEKYWGKSPAIDGYYDLIINRGHTGIHWLNEQIKESKSKVLYPHYWRNEEFGISNPNNPVVGISWYEASAYCEWLSQNWYVLAESKVNSTLIPKTVRLPLVTEWVTAAGGDQPSSRYPWDKLGQVTQSSNGIYKRANVRESEIGHTTPVNRYPLGKSPFEVMDMVGNVWEYQANFLKIPFRKFEGVELRGGSWNSPGTDGRIGVGLINTLDKRDSSSTGFRVVCIPE